MHPTYYGIGVPKFIGIMLFWPKYQARYYPREGSHTWMVEFHRMMIVEEEGLADGS